MTLASNPAILSILSDERLEGSLVDSLAKALFEEQDRLMPGDDTWEDQAPHALLYWRSSARSVILELVRIIKR